MAIQRHNGNGWAGAARATYALFEKNVSGGPPIWLRARTIWRSAGGTARQPATPGYAEAADFQAVTATTLERTLNGGTEIEDPVTGDPNVYWESYVELNAG